MRWCRVYHPDLPAFATIPESAVTIHRGAGWVRVGEYVDDQDHAVDPDGPLIDLDLPEPAEPDPEPPAGRKTAAKTTKKEAGTS